MSYREIKFRGKIRNTGEWIHGAFIPADYTYWREPSIVNLNRRFEINPKTLGMYTGFHDDNGIEIYEGDILDISIYFLGTGKEKTFRSAVEFAKGAMEVRESGEFAYNFDYLMTCDFIKSIVIGNIYDNPELAKEE